MSVKTRKKEEKKPVSYKKSIIILSILILSFIIYKTIYSDKTQTGTEQTDSAIPQLSDPGVQRGMKLASQQCQSCHLLPSPSLIDKKSWETVLPKMALRLGIKSHRGESYESYDPQTAAEESKLLPTHPALNESEWQDILDYYAAIAPSTLPSQNRSVPQEAIKSFSIVSPPSSLSRKKLMATYVKIDNSVKPARIFAYELYSSRLFLLNNKLEIMDSIHIDGIIVDMNFQNDQILAVSLGTKINIRDSEKFGKIFPITVSSSGKLGIKAPLFQNLARPLQVIPTDLNADGLKDYLICEFGHLTGALTWMENKGGGNFERHVIRNLPGSIKAYIRPDKQTGRPDLWVLFGQGEEGIFHFINKGGGKFEEKEVLRFPPIYGSSSFEMVDIDHDGYEDIVYTCGDNGDYSKVLKPYHGVYIFKNDGKDNFTQQYFYPINGSYKVIARDFRNTGEIDLAVASFFTDLTKPQESFIYLQNEQGFKFHPYILPQGKTLEDLLTMESGDIDGDGKPDLILGNAFPFPGQPGYNKQEPLFVVLRNLGK